MHTFDCQVLHFKLIDVKERIAYYLDTDSDPFLDQLLHSQTELKAALLAKYKAAGAAAASNTDPTLLPAAQSAPTSQASHSCQLPVVACRSAELPQQ